MSLAWVPNICEMFTRSGKKKINNFLNSPKRLTLPNKFTKVRKIHFSRVFRKKEKSSIGHILLEKSKFPSVATTWNWCLTQRPLRLGQYASEADQFLVWLPASLDPEKRKTQPKGRCQCPTTGMIKILCAWVSFSFQEHATQTANGSELFSYLTSLHTTIILLSIFSHKRRLVWKSWRDQYPSIRTSTSCFRPN